MEIAEKLYQDIVMQLYYVLGRAIIENQFIAVVSNTVTQKQIQIMLKMARF